jgi:hypothetical protein
MQTVQGKAWYALSEAGQRLSLADAWRQADDTLISPILSSRTVSRMVRNDYARESAKSKTPRWLVEGF